MAKATPPRRPAPVAAKPANPSAKPARPVKPTTTKPAPAAAPKPTAKPAVPSKYVHVSIKGADGKVVRVLMEQSKANALAKKRATARGVAKDAAATAATAALVPAGYRDLVDPSSIAKAVDAQIAALNSPLGVEQGQAQTQTDTNIRMSGELNAQTQASLDQLVANANARTTGFQQLAGQGIAAQQATNQAAASAMAHALGPALNTQTADLVGQQLEPMTAQQNAAGVQDVWAQTLASGAQKDFFERGKGIAAVTQQAFNEGQRKNLAAAMARINAEMAANTQQRPTLVRQMAGEEAQFALSRAEQETAANAAAAAFGLDKFKAETGRLSVKEQAAADKASASAKVEAAKVGAGQKAATSQAQALAKVKAAVDKQRQQVLSGTKNVSVQAKGPDGKPLFDPKTHKPVYITQTIKTTNGQVFGPNNGPWREAFTQLTVNYGMDPNAAAIAVSKWYPESITRSDKNKIAAMLKQRGVTGAALNQIVAQAPAPAAAAKPAAGGGGQPGHQTAAQQKASTRAEAGAFVRAIRSQPNSGKAIWNGSVWSLSGKLGTWKGRPAYIFHNPAGATMYVAAELGKGPIDLVNHDGERILS